MQCTVGNDDDHVLIDDHDDDVDVGLGQVKDTTMTIENEESQLSLQYSLLLSLFSF